MSPEAIVVISDGAEDLSDWKFKFANIGSRNVQCLASDDEVDDFTIYGK